MKYRESLIAPSQSCNSLARTLLVVVLLGLILCFLPELTSAQSEKEDPFFSNRQKVPVTISLRSTGILAKDGVSVEQTDTSVDIMIYK